MRISSSQVRCGPSSSTSRMTAFQRPEKTPSARSTGKPGSLLMIFIRH